MKTTSYIVVVISLALTGVILFMNMPPNSGAGLVAWVLSPYFFLLLMTGLVSTRTSVFATLVLAVLAGVIGLGLMILTIYIEQDNDGLLFFFLPPLQWVMLLIASFILLIVKSWAKFADWAGEEASPPVMTPSENIPAGRKFQLVLQFPGDSEEDLDAVIDLEGQIANALGEHADLDGHDTGPGQTYLFILTDDPTATFQAAKPVLKKANRLKDLTAAFRDEEGRDYTVIWPSGSKKKFEVLLGMADRKSVDDSCDPQ